MKKLLLLLLLPSAIYAQGTLVYDQQSAVEGTGGNQVIIQGAEPLGQSFTPTLNSVGFIRLFLQDGNTGNNLGATVYLNLRSDSITGPVLSSTAPVFMPDGYGVGPYPYNGYTDFFFATSVGVTPGTTYFFDVNVQSGDIWRLIAYGYGYPSGVAFAHGAGDIVYDQWFREGIVAVPEPSAAWLVLFGGAVLLVTRRCKAS